jgi:hypothetical protein
MRLEFMQPAAVPFSCSLRADAHLAGKVKWYTTPIAFGGDFGDEISLNWVTHEQHRRAVVWWNAKYQELKPFQAGPA